MSALEDFIEQYKKQDWFISAKWEENEYGPYIAVTYNKEEYKSDCLMLNWRYPLRWVCHLTGRTCNRDYKYYSTTV